MSARLLGVDETAELLMTGEEGLARHVEAGQLHPIRERGEEARFSEREVSNLVRRLASEAGAVPELDLAASARIGAQLDQLRATVNSYLGAVVNGADPLAASHSIGVLIDELEDTVREAGSAA